MRFPRLAVAALLIAAAPVALPPAPSPTFADIASLTLASPVVVRATVTRAERLNAKTAPDVAPDRARLLVRAALAAALRAPTAVPAEIEYLVEVPLDARRKPPRLKGAPVLLFLRPGAQPGQYVLTSARAQLAATAAAEATARAVLVEDKAGTAPVVTGVGNAFRVPGAVPGEAESQFFVTTRDRPVSLVVLTRPEGRTLNLALGEIVDDAAGPVRRDTLLWYRLACFLPRSLPDGVGGDERTALADDYAFVLATLGPCTRNLYGRLITVCLASGDFRNAVTCRDGC